MTRGRVQRLVDREKSISLSAEGGETPGEDAGPVTGATAGGILRGAPSAVHRLPLHVGLSFIGGGWLIPVREFPVPAAPGRSTAVP